MPGGVGCKIAAAHRNEKDDPYAQPPGAVAADTPVTQPQPPCALSAAPRAVARSWMSIERWRGMHAEQGIQAVVGRLRAQYPAARILLNAVLPAGARSDIERLLKQPRPAQPVALAADGVRAVAAAPNRARPRPREPGGQSVPLRPAHLPLKRADLPDFMRRDGGFRNCGARRLPAQCAQAAPIL